MLKSSGWGKVMTYLATKKAQRLIEKTTGVFVPTKSANKGKEKTTTA
jgi:hypothetical protein